eukprot:CAMPEP_0117442426 /NCGR_PEP_ID=MMETSP0759-20121206/4144_1 /TAXON_ID=63605 /ORGANISM="Percolomonas cosmopolitus, Strain WS" /LENGTH=64 /DNA_ID=CAMNT_0005234311 /DNA_START=153 /DNA_END=347 /DNA_ORIENTATION=-
MTRGPQRERERERAQKKADKKKPKGDAGAKNEGQAVKNRMLNDAEIMRQKQLKAEEKKKKAKAK